MKHNRLNMFGEELGRLLEFQNISINEYAERIGTTPKNLIDIIDGNIALSFNMICNIAFISSLSVDYICNVESNYKIEKSLDEFINKEKITIRGLINRFNYKELKEKYEIKYSDDRNDYHIMEDILKYLRITDINLIYKDNNHIFYKSKNDKPELLSLWLERCYKIIQSQELNEYKKDNINILVNFIRNEAKNNSFNKDKLIHTFNNNGIFLAIEDDLKGSKIRGSFRVLNNKPAIYLTTKNKRIADIYFALLHELAHCKSDYNRAKSGSIISYTEENNNENYEINADKLALSWMVPNEEYKYILNNQSYKYDIMSFLAYRMAIDGKIKYNSKFYQDNNKIININ